jgi:signal transduction histidine kinase
VLDGSTDGLPAGVDLSVYRIVQEGLTNVLKHAPGTTVRVGYHRRPDGVDVDLRSGRGRLQAELASTGRGLVGMRERVALFGGDLDATTTDDGGYVVRARLPVVATA